MERLSLKWGQILLWSWWIPKAALRMHWVSSWGVTVLRKIQDGLKMIFKAWKQWASLRTMGWLVQMDCPQDTASGWLSSGKYKMCSKSFSGHQMEWLSSGDRQWRAQRDCPQEHAWSWLSSGKMQHVSRCIFKAPIGVTVLRKIQQ